MRAPLLLAVYSARNADRVVRLIEPARHAGWEIALRTLDEVPPALADVTLGRGPGLRLANLNDLLEQVGGLPRWVVLSDDDVEFVRGDVVLLVAECAAAGFGLAQPAHASGSHVSHPHTRVVRRSRARAVPYVEAGPVSVVSPTWSERVLPSLRGAVWAGGSSSNGWTTSRMAACSAWSIESRTSISTLSAGRTTRRPSAGRWRRTSPPEGSTTFRPRRSRSRPGGHGGAGPHGRRDDRRQMAQVRAAVRQPDRPRQPLVLARGGARDRGASALPGLPRL